ncbi:MAG TPA: DNA mismatch repair endonuclease MutL [bacterium]
MELSSKIKILPEDLTNKIAAGEVVDRPASVVKELVENAIDAGATEITTIIKDGGKALIQVVDNGSGMHQSDLMLAFQRHATSKIFTYEDLVDIHTLGFRGEALASIASVAHVEGKSVLPGESSGHLLRIEGGVMHGMEATAGQPGTSIAVKHLFYNTPARRKFLRANSTEYRQILTVLNRFFLAFPDIQFTLVNEGELVLELKPQAHDERVAAVLGQRVQKNLIPIANEGPIQISGFTGNQDTMRSSRGDQYLFFNRRYFSNKSLNYAAVSAYGDILPRGYFPVYIIFLSMPPEQADVNVHPTKMEIKFANEALVFSTVRGAIKRALTTNAVVPELSSDKKMPGLVMPAATGSDPRQNRFDFRSGRPPLTTTEPVNITGQAGPPPNHEDAPAEFRNASAPRSKEIYERINVWQIHNKYIVSQIKSGLIIIDQHVAHERILYEQALDNFERRKPASQQLLFPQVVELSAEDYSLLLDIVPFLERIGFIVNAFGKNTVVVEGVPSGLRIRDDERILLDILDQFKREKKESIDIRDNVAKSFACHSAIKAGEPLSLESMNSLIDQLFVTREPYFCPHGRPVIITLSLDELDRRFRRH